MKKAGQTDSETDMKKLTKTELIASCGAGGVILALGVLLGVFIALNNRKNEELAYVESLYRTVYVCVDDDLFSAYAGSCSDDELKTVEDSVTVQVVSRSAFTGSILAEEPLAVCGATVSRTAAVTFAGLPENTDTVTHYLLSGKSWLPGVAADFTDNMAVTDPGLTISLTGIDDLPAGSRALPVDGKYAGDADYGLEQKKYATCTVLLSPYRDSIFSLCETLFTDPDFSAGRRSPVFVASVGDIMVARGAEQVLINDEQGLEKVFGHTLPILQNNDITIGNLEGVVTTNTKNATKTYTFKFQKAVLEPLKKAGFTYFMQTNNHCYDYGEAGFKDTLAALKEYGIPTSGAGSNAEEAARFYHTEIDGVKFAIISCGAYPVERSGFNGQTMATATKDRAGILWQNDRLFEDIAKEKAAGNLVIVNIHGGEEYVFKPNATQRALYEKLIDSGADVVFGSHPHVLQPTEWYNNGLIVYSMGNFIFNGMEGMYGATDSEIVRLGFLDGNIAYVEIYPARLSGYTVDLK